MTASALWFLSWLSAGGLLVSIVWALIQAWRGSIVWPDALRSRPVLCVIWWLMLCVCLQLVVAVLMATGWLPWASLRTAPSPWQ